MPAPKLYPNDTTIRRSLSLPSQVVAQAEKAAQEAGVSLSQWVTGAVKEKLERKENENVKD